MGYLEFYSQNIINFAIKKKSNGDDGLFLRFIGVWVNVMMLLEGRPPSKASEKQITFFFLIYCINNFLVQMLAFAA